MNIYILCILCFNTFTLLDLVCVCMTCGNITNQLVCFTCHF